jgi:hypothetical protein
MPPNGNTRCPAQGTRYVRLRIRKSAVSRHLRLGGRIDPGNVC